MVAALHIESPAIQDETIAERRRDEIGRRKLIRAPRAAHPVRAAVTVEDIVAEYRAHEVHSARRQALSGPRPVPTPVVNEEDVEAPFGQHRSACRAGGARTNDSDFGVGPGLKTTPPGLGMPVAKTDTVPVTPESAMRSIRLAVAFALLTYNAPRPS